MVAYPALEEVAGPQAPQTKVEQRGSMVSQEEAAARARGQAGAMPETLRIRAALEKP